MRLTVRANELQDTRRLTDAEVIDQARAIGGLNGFAILDRLKIWRKSGLWKHKIWAFASVDLSDAVRVRQVINAFGAIDLGVALAAAWQSNCDWDTGAGRGYRPGSWGLHSVPAVGYDTEWLYVVTWGHLCRLSWNALPVYCDEAYCVIDPDWIAADAASPSGLDLAALHGLLYASTGAGILRQKSAQNAS
jgi:hypothetical protein